MFLWVIRFRFGKRKSEKRKALERERNRKQTSTNSSFCSSLFKNQNPKSLSLKTKNQNPQSPKALRSSFRWTSLSKKILARDVFCLNPFGKCGGSIAKEVHHIRSVRSRKDLAFSPQNLISLCSGCHSIATTLEKKNLESVWIFEEILGVGSQKSLGSEPFKTAQSVEKNVRTNFGGTLPRCKRIPSEQDKVFCYRRCTYQSVFCGICEVNKNKI